MVYSRNRAYIKAMALCALSLMASSAEKNESTITCELSDGDKNFGIRSVQDTGCINGGLGCYNDYCRYCKLLDTPKSTQFVSCSSFGANFPSMAPLTVTTGSCEISSGDAAAGIAAVVDTDCLYGGLGCFTDHCRFCKVKDTPESTAFIGCADFNGSVTIVDSPPTTSMPTVAVPITTTKSTASCSLSVSDGDASVGINIVTDESCASGGVGCIDDVCRFCRMTTTVQSATFTDCSSIAKTVKTPTDAPTETPTDAPTETPTDAPTDVPTETPTDAPTESPSEIPTQAPVSSTTCEQVAAEGDLKAGITIVTDSSCVTGGIGCISDVCRYCRLVYTQQSATFTDCGSILGTTEAPTYTPSATAVTSEIPTEAPSDIPTTSSGCTQLVSAGDASVGINIVTDTSCASGGVGCIDKVCRFCRVVSTSQSSAFVDCTSVTGYSTSAVTDKPSDAPIAAITDAPTDAPTVPTPTEVPSQTPAATLSDSACTQVASDGDVSAGIHIFTDTSCANGGVGCIDNVCRFCKFTTTVQSASFVDCPSV